MCASLPPTALHLPVFVVLACGSCHCTCSTVTASRHGTSRHVRRREEKCERRQESLGPGRATSQARGSELVCVLTTEKLTTRLAIVVRALLPCKKP